MKILVTLFLLFIGLSHGITQVSFSTVKHDFGSLQPYSDRYIDVIISNEGTKKEWVLSVNKPSEVVYITSKQFIEVGEETMIRLQVNPRSKGRFNYTVNVYTSDRQEATRIKLSGTLEEAVPSNASPFTACPSFEDRPSGKRAMNFDLTVVTIDKKSRAPLSKSNVTMLQGGQPVWTNQTDKRGQIKEESTLGLSYFYATHEGYFPAELGAYVNFQRNYIVVELEKNETEPPKTPVALDTSQVENLEEPEDIVIEIEERLEQELSEVKDSTTVLETPLELAELSLDNFEDQHFHAINVVFVLDVSSSMRMADKIELMKYSLFQLTDMLRPQDKMGIVTYSSSARVLLESTAGSNKDEIKTEVKSLEAAGYTSGGEGIKLGYRKALEAKINGGVNQVIIITDGAFNRNSKGYKKVIKKYQKKGVRLSVVGIKNKSIDEKEMRAIAELGGGHYVPIFKLKDAQNNLRQEIRIQSFKQP